MRRQWIEISSSRLAHNLRAIREAAGEEVLAVIKADAYGHGAALCAPVLALAGAGWFGVTDAAEGAEVRRALAGAGLDAEILVMSGSLPEETAVLEEHRLVPVVWTAAQVGALRGLEQRRVQIEVDTGMSRQGARPGAELDALLAAVQAAGLRLDGIFTHLCCSEVAQSAGTDAQYGQLAAAVAQVRSRGMRADWVHIANSSGVDNPARPGGWLRELAASIGGRPMVRTGLALYGYALPIAPAAGPGALASRGAAAEARLRPALRPVLTWKARILAVRALAAGETVGYGATFTAPAAMRVALLPVGYADGLRRELSNPGPSGGRGGWVVTDAGRCCPILGRVSMNLTVVDISGAPEMAAGDAVTLLGAGVSAEDHARAAGTIAYEILCGLRSVPHRLVD